MRRRSLSGVGWICALVSALVALAAFAQLAHSVWAHRPPDVDARTLLTHPHLLGLKPRTEWRLALYPMVAFVCLMSMPLLRVGVRRGLRTWRGALVGSAVAATLLLGGGVYRYHHPPRVSECFPAGCTLQRNRPAAIEDTTRLGYVAGGVVLATLIGIPALRSGRRTRPRPL